MIDSIKQTYGIEAPVSKVFSALSEPEELVSWFLKSAELEHKKGGKYRFAWLWNSFKQEGNVLDFKQNEKLALEWPSAGEGSVVTFTTKKDGTGTLLTMLQSGFRDNDRKLSSLAGWTYYLTNLKSVLENDKDLRHEVDDVFGR